MLIVAQQDSQASQSVIDGQIAKLISNIGLLNEAKNLHIQLQPIAKALDRLHRTQQPLLMHVKNGLFSCSTMI